MSLPGAECLSKQGVVVFYIVLEFREPRTRDESRPKRGRDCKVGERGTAELKIKNKVLQRNQIDLT